MVHICYVFSMLLHADVYLSITVSYFVFVCVRTTFLFTWEPTQMQLWELQPHTWHTAAFIKKPIDDSDPALLELERERGWRRGEGKGSSRWNVSSLLYCSNTDPSVNKSFTLTSHRLCLDMGLPFHFPPTECPSPLHLHCTLMFTKPLQGAMHRSGHGS